MQSDGKSEMTADAATDADVAVDIEAVEMIEYDEQQYLFDLDCVFRFAVELSAFLSGCALDFSFSLFSLCFAHFPSPYLSS